MTLPSSLAHRSVVQLLTSSCYDSSLTSYGSDVIQGDRHDGLRSGRVSEYAISYAQYVFLGDRRDELRNARVGGYAVSCAQ